MQFWQLYRKFLAHSPNKILKFWCFKNMFKRFLWTRNEFREYQNCLILYCNKMQPPLSPLSIGAYVLLEIFSHFILEPFLPTVDKNSRSNVAPLLLKSIQSPENITATIFTIIFITYLCIYLKWKNWLLVCAFPITFATKSHFSIFQTLPPTSSTFGVSALSHFPQPYAASPPKTGKDLKLGSFRWASTNGSLSNTFLNLWIFRYFSKISGSNKSL